MFLRICQKHQERATWHPLTIANRAQTRSRNEQNDKGTVYGQAPLLCCGVATELPANSASIWGCLATMSLFRETGDTPYEKSFEGMPIFLANTTSSTQLHH